MNNNALRALQDDFFYSGSTKIGYLFFGIRTSVAWTESSFSRGLHLWKRSCNRSFKIKTGKRPTKPYTPEICYMLEIDPSQLLETVRKNLEKFVDKIFR